MLTLAKYLLNVGLTFVMLGGRENLLGENDVWYHYVMTKVQHNITIPLLGLFKRSLPAKFNC